MLILMLSGDETLNVETIRKVDAADMVIDPRGVVIKSTAENCPSRINIAELRRVLTTKAKPRRSGYDEQAAAGATGELAL